MRSVTVRLMLLILFMAALAATGYFIWTSETAWRTASDAARRFDDDTAAAERGVLELRAAQHAYVAAGQGEDFWIAKAVAALTDLKASIGALRAHDRTPRAQTALENALAILHDFEQIDKRAAGYTRSGQRLIASDLIFSDGLEMTAAAMAALQEARGAERQELDRLSSEIRRAELAALGSCGAWALLVVALLVPVRKQRATQLPQPAISPAAAARISRDDEGLDLVFAMEHVEEKRTPDRAPVAVEPRPPAPANLDSLASLCGDIARVADNRSLPSILERTAAVLNASGIVLWIADPDGRELTPIVAHGYSTQMLSRLGRLSRDAQNVTSAAFRTGLVQTVKGDAVSNGAIAAPLMTPAGSVGVMAAEVREEAEQQDAKLAAASIVAAQLATLVGPPVSRTHSKAESAGA